jgi:hypothetical protein
MFADDIASKGERVVERNVKVALTQSEFDALVYSAYNGGAGQKVWTAVNSKNYETMDVFTAFLDRRISNGVELPGLISRRAEEAWIYLYGTAPSMSNRTMSITVCSSKDVNKEVQRSVTILTHNAWINSWNKYADQVDPLPSRIRQAGLRRVTQ